MSLMDGLSNQSEAQPNSNNNESNPNQDNLSYLDRLVAEKGDNWKDPEVLAKGKLESDNYIAELKRQNEELKAKAIEGDTVSMLLSELEKRALGETNTPNTPAESNYVSQGEGETTSQPITPDQIAELVAKTLSERETTSIAQKNESEVKDFLIKNYGTEAIKVVHSKAAELGMSSADMDELAKKSPTAFYNLIGAKPPVSEPIGQGSVNAQAFQNQTNSNVRDWQYYQKLRKENPRQYRSGAIQNQMMQDKKALGDRFGNS